MSDYYKMDKIIIGEVLLIFIFFLLFWYRDVQTFFMENNMGRLLLILLFMVYYYLDKYLGLLFCLMIIFVHHINKRESFSVYTENMNNNLEVAEDDFRQKNCANGELVYKGNAVKKDMMEHVFPEITFADTKCNPCDPTCAFNIIEEEGQNDQPELHVSTMM